jgi:hypothetical protein
MKKQHSVKAIAVAILALGIGAASAQDSNGDAAKASNAKADATTTAVANSSPLANAKVTTVAPNVNADTGNLNAGVSASVSGGNDAAVPKVKSSAKDKKDDKDDNTEPDNQ